VAVERGSKLKDWNIAGGVVHQSEENDVGFLDGVDGCERRRAEMPSQQCGNFEVALNHELARVGIACESAIPQGRQLVRRDERKLAYLVEVLLVRITIGHGSIIRLPG
jgi:hypothetical protein